MASVSWGHDLSTLARSPKWLRLGHYERTLFGTTSPFRGPFFIHPDGYQDPKKELAATIEAFRRPTAEHFARFKMHPQCFFAARFRWLRQQVPLEPAVPCEERRAWKERLNARAVSLIFAAADMNNAPSTFGHTFLKLINPDNRGGRELVDYGINYAADGDPNEALFYAIKGLIGLYGGLYSMLPYHQKIRQYVNMEGRDLWEYPIHLSAEQIDELVDHLLELEGSRAPYYFLSDNCSYQIMKALEVVSSDLDVTAHLPWFVIPLDTLKLAARTPGFLGPPIFQRSLKSEYLEDRRQLTTAQRDLLDTTLVSLNVHDHLPREERARVLEAAMKFYALRSYGGAGDSKAQHQLAVERARLGPMDPPPARSRPQPPHLSHDSSALHVGGGLRRGRGFESLRLRPAFHDLEQADEGLAPFSRIEVATLELRHSSGWSLHRATLANLLSTTPLTALDHHLSWRATVEVLDPWTANVLGGAGVSYEPWPNLRVVQLLNGRYTGSFLGAGPNVIVATRLGRLGLALDAAYYFGWDDRRLWDGTVRLAWRLTPQWDVQSEIVEREWNLRLVYNFLL